MKVRDLMRSIPRHTSAGESLASAGRTMADAGVGVLPVIDADRRVVAVLTDRDICCAVARENRRPSDLRVAEVASAPPWVCEPGDDLSTALATMRTHAVRRLPVVDAFDRLEGLLSLDEVVLASHLLAGDKLGAPVHAEVIETMQAIMRPATALVSGHATAGAAS
jgi:CBS domain-containing protein